MSRIFNFSPGPAKLPRPVLEQAQAELLDWNGTGVSILETSHRALQFEALGHELTHNLRRIANIPSDYKILWMQGGGRGQFSMIPMNLLGEKKSADYVINGLWSHLAADEARKYCHVNPVVQARDIVPDLSMWACDENAAYLHYTDNETVDGLEFSFVPDITTDVPLVADMTSNFLSKPIDMTQFSLIHAAAQKNFGPSGVTLVIVHESLLDRALPMTPSFCHYKTFSELNSFYQTPPTMSWYIVNLVLKWIEAQGGLERLAEKNQEKADLLYQTIDESDFYRNHIAPEHRSRMNIVFRLTNNALEACFLEEAQEANFIGLKGHKSVGGIRASMYNAMPISEVQALCEFMKHFEAKHG